MVRPQRLIPGFQWRLVLVVLLTAVPLSLAAGLFFSWIGALFTAGVLILAATLTLLVLTPWFRRRVVNPLVDMETKVGQWRKERFDVFIPLAFNDEVGSLAGRLNSMAGHFEKVFAKLTVRARMDLLTGLPSRSQLLLDISLTTQPALILVNIDSFKEINDSMGNRAGDEVLVALTERLEGFQSTLPYRLYKMPADEFALLFDWTMDDGELAALAASLAHKMNETDYVLGGQKIDLHVTCGLARGIAGVQDVLEHGAWPHLLEQADMAMKEAKRTHRAYLLFQESLAIQKEFENNLYWKNAVSAALKDNRIQAFYQPIIDNSTGKIVKYETLVRLIGADHAVHLPEAFLEPARRSHLDAAITRTMVSQSFAAFEQRPFEFSINLTVRDMLSPEVSQFLHDEIAAHPQTARRLVIEILESEGIENYREVKQFISLLKEAGVKVAIDDFGTGYSNFAHILRLEVDYIKLDSSLIQNLDTDRNAQIIVKTIVGFSKELGLKTISEHVHTPEIQQEAQRLGVDYSQGFYLGRPAPLENS